MMFDYLLNIVQTTIQVYSYVYSIVYLIRAHSFNILYFFFQVYAASNVELITKTRTSHLSDQNKNKTKGKGESS